VEPNHQKVGKKWLLFGSTFFPPLKRWNQTSKRWEKVVIVWLHLFKGGKKVVIVWLHLFKGGKKVEI
jgi:hypothetical protein